MGLPDLHEITHYSGCFVGWDAAQWSAAKKRLRHGFESSARFCWAMYASSCTWSRFLVGPTFEPPKGMASSIEKRMISVDQSRFIMGLSRLAWDPWIRNYPGYITSHPFKHTEEIPRILHPLQNTTYLLLQNASSHPLLINAPPPIKAIKNHQKPYRLSIDIRMSK